VSTINASIDKAVGGKLAEGKILVASSLDSLMDPTIPILANQHGEEQKSLKMF